MSIKSLQGRRGVPLPKEEKTRPGHTCTIMQNFAPIGVSIAEISGAVQKKTDTADLISDKMHTSICQITSR